MQWRTLNEHFVGWIRGLNLGIETLFWQVDGVSQTNGMSHPMTEPDNPLQLARRPYLS